MLSNEQLNAMRKNAPLLVLEYEKIMEALEKSIALNVAAKEHLKEARIALGTERDANGSLNQNLLNIKAELDLAKGEIDACYTHLEKGAAHPLVAESFRRQPLVTWFQVAAQNVKSLTDECANWKKKYDELCGAFAATTHE